MPGDRGMVLVIGLALSNSGGELAVQMFSTAARDTVQPLSSGHMMLTLDMYKHTHTHTPFPRLQYAGWLHHLFVQIPTHLLLVPKIVLYFQDMVVSPTPPLTTSLFSLVVRTELNHYNLVIYNILT